MNGNRGKRENNGQMLQLQQRYSILYAGDVNVDRGGRTGYGAEFVEVHW